MGTLDGKTAFVTGGSRGIGAAVVRRLAQDGAAVAFTYLGSGDKAEALADEVRASGGTALPIKADSANATELTQAIATAADQLGGLDILVGNAGIARVAPIDQMSLEDFDATLAINVRAVWVGAQAAAQHMRDGGRIVTIGSVNAERVPVAGLAAYATSKAALVGLTKGLARDFAARQITVNLVQPGPVDTDMNPADGPFAPVLKGFLALPRYAEAGEIAGTVAYLTSAEAGYVTGSAISIDGGFLS